MRLEDIKPESVEDPRKPENSPSTVGGIVMRYTTKTIGVIKAIPGAVVSFTYVAIK